MNHRSRSGWHVAARMCITALFLLTACATEAPSPDISAIDAIERYERAEIVVIDVRSAEEAAVGSPKFHAPRIQFGPDEWGDVDDEHVSDFIGRLAPSMSEGKPVVLLCQRGIRSGAAVRALARRGISARSVADGYLGNNHGPGWRTWE